MTTLRENDPVGVLLQPTERVLSTLNADGKRRWLRPRLSKGRIWNVRRWVAYGLITIYATVPYFRVGGFPLVLLDVIHRRFHIAGITFLPTDTKLLALLLLMVGLSVFLATAVLGRVWCGWACPQTVYMEFVFRPIERLFCGTKGRGGSAKRVAAWRVCAMYLVYIAIAFHLAHTLLSYFVGVTSVHQWIWHSTPFEHPAAFTVVALATAWIVWDFAYWREQMCMIGCPYGRMQSVLLDRNSLIVSYDKARGEPRRHKAATKSKKCDRSCEKCGEPKFESTSSCADATRPLTLLETTTVNSGDCIDCSMCVQVCPTGIDIRDGLQLECISCAQCIDACDAVMDKVKRPRGLIGYASEAQRSGERRSWRRPRLIVYPAMLLILATLFVYFLVTRSAFDLTVLRGVGRPFNVLADGDVENTMRLKIVNRTDGPRRYSIAVIGEHANSAAVKVDGDMTLDPLETCSPVVRIAVSADRFTSDHTDVEVRIRSDRGETIDRLVRLIGPIARTEVSP